MFNIEENIRSWKKGLRKGGDFEDGDIEELESHLRDEIEKLISDGLTEEKAYQKAVEKIGEPEIIGIELHKTKVVSEKAFRHKGNESFSAALVPNYIKTAFRIIKKNPIYSSINMAGLAVGLACFVLIAMYLQYETSFDTFHENKDHIYRLNKVVTPKTGGTELHALSSGAMGPQLLQDYQEIDNIARVRPWFNEVLLSYEQELLKVDNFIIADATFIDIFSFELLEGDPNTALNDPLSMVVSEEVAAHFFGSESPIGKSIKGLNDLDYTITGIIKNAPENSHLDYDVLVSWASTGPAGLDFSWLNVWLTQAVFTYVQLKPGTDPEVLEAQFPRFMETYFPQRADQYALYLDPLNEIYLQKSDIQYDDEVRTGSITNLYIFAVVALLILLIACINFVNLTTARSTLRGPEVGIRKALGALRRQLRVQYMSESLLLSFLAMCIALALIILSKPLLLYIGIPEELTQITNRGDIVIMLLGITFGVGALSGVYPSLVLSGFKPVETLYGRTSKTWRGDEIIRKGLVTIQFSLSIILIVSTITVYNQMNYVSEKDLGFKKEQIVIVPIGSTPIKTQAEAFKNELLKNSAITQITVSATVPGFGFSSYGINPEGKADDESWVSNVMQLVDDELVSTYSMEMQEGRFFSSELASDSAGIVINEALVRSLGWTDPIGKKLDVPGELETGTVIGVVKDFNTESLYKGIDPLVMFIDKNRSNFLSLRINANGLSETLSYIGDTWKAFDQTRPFEYRFLDETFDQFYAAEQKMLNILSLFAGLAIFIACLGLFGLSAFMVTQRKKEIGIRKVLGSSVSSIMMLISKDFLKLVGFGFVIAIPVSYWLTLQWLNEFAYRIEIGASVFVVSGILVIIMAIIAVFWQAMGAALMNPVHSLKSE